MTREELIEALKDEERNDGGPSVILALACAISGGIVGGILASLGFGMFCRAMGW